MLMTDSWSSSKLFRTHVFLSNPNFSMPPQHVVIDLFAPFRNGTVFRDLLPLRIVYFCRTLATGSLNGIASPDSFRNGTVFRDLLPLRIVYSCRTLATGPLNGIASPDSFRNGTISRDLLPLRNILMDFTLP